MADNPHLTLLRASLAANATGTATFQAPANERYFLRKLRYIATGAFSITDIRDSSNNHYTNSGQSIPLLSTLLQNAASPNLALDVLEDDIEIPGGSILYIDLIDTSANPNVITFMFSGRKETT